MITSPSRWSMVALLRRLRAVSRTRLAISTLIVFLFASIVGWSEQLFLLALLTLPVIAFFRRVCHAQTQYDIKDREVAQLLITFFGGIFPGAFLAIAVESALAPLFAIICFYDQKDSLVPQLREFLDHKQQQERPQATPSVTANGRINNVLQTLEIQQTFGYYVFLFLTAFVVAACVEEATKLWLVQSKCLCNCSSGKRGWLCDPRRLLFKRVTHSNHHVVVVLALIAAALGFSFIENVGFTFVAQTWSDRLESALLRSLISTPLHCLCGAITGMRLARRGAMKELLPEASMAPRKKCSPSFPKLWVLWPAICVHGTFDLQIFLVSSWISTEMAALHPFVYGLLLPSLVTLAVLAGAYKWTQKEWQWVKEEIVASGGGHGAYAHLRQENGEDEDADDARDDSEEEDVEAGGYKRSTRGILMV